MYYEVIKLNTHNNDNVDVILNTRLTTLVLVSIHKITTDTIKYTHNINSADRIIVCYTTQVI